MKDIITIIACMLIIGITIYFLDNDFHIISKKNWNCTRYVTKAAEAIQDADLCDQYTFQYGRK